MSRITHVSLMARYNQWMNDKVYAAAATLPETELTADRKAFFGSIVGTLNHLLLADTIWLKRFANHSDSYITLAYVRDLPAPQSLDQSIYPDFASMTAQRKHLDQVILDWTDSLSESDLFQVLHYRNMKGDAMSKPLFGLLMHFFNHQTHHRGQASTLLFQAGVDVGVTDLAVLVPDA